MAVKAPEIQQTNTQGAWHTVDTDAVVRRLNVDLANGISEQDATARLAQYGANELVEKKLKSPWAILWEQITNPLVLLLIFAAVISAFLGKADSVIAISAIVVLNAILGVVQEYRAEQAMAALKKMSAPLVRVRRGGRVSDIESRSVVPGDLVLLEAGSIVPADARLVESANLRVAEAALTGESQPVEKAPGVIADEKAPLGDRSNMVYMGTSVTYGRGTALIVETGMQTELGRIAELIQGVESEKTPLQRRMDELGGVLIRAALIVMGIAVVVGLIAGDSIQDVLLNAVAIAVAVVPEGLPAVVTIALALGAQRMLRRRALIRKLPAVETLGSVTTICSDKTGTLTENKMTVTVMDVAGSRAKMDEAVAVGMARLITDGSGNSAHAVLLAGDALCNDAALEQVQPGEWKTVGDPTEGALLVAAANYGLVKPHLERVFPRVGEVPFDSDRKRMTTIHTLEANATLSDSEGYVARLLNLRPLDYVAFTKGAVDTMLDRSTHVWYEGKAVPLTAEWRRRIEDATNDLAQNGLRVLGMGFRHLTELPANINPETVEIDLTFVGMVGIIDPPRKEVKDAVAVAKTAGIRPVMITGDHPLTAYAIARELGIAKEGDQVLTGHDLNQMSQTDLENVVENVAVYARVSPENKLNIVQALQTKGHIAAMTGDGVNDAPALKKSDIGVAMGITGTAVSKEASDMVILDDNFATIVSAVEEGRTIYDNVRRFIKYLLASNTGELIVLLTTQLIAGMTLPLTTLQILWMNLITDGIPALALGVEQAEKGGMKRAPYAPNESLFGRGLGRHIVIVGALLGISGVALGYWAFANNITAANGAPAWNTMVFIFLTIAQMGHALALRSHRESIFTVGLAGNRLLIGAVIVTIVLQLIAIYTPFFNNLFNTNPLTLDQLLICLVLSTVVFWGVELEKLLMRRGILK
ncbi:MAG: cation-translocating P-type ATPase [Chloroflexi bacterium]|uniref:cation-translocating P-type ATPase n=1 Tax=Candidatus Flexifilum breve TaxID=3140694 RepID=UPI0031350177|nr:cation-translocating P-type ATPase [Chloroflexota bacterium]